MKKLEIWEDFRMAINRQRLDQFKQEDPFLKEQLFISIINMTEYVYIKKIWSFNVILYSRRNKYYQDCRNHKKMNKFFVGLYLYQKSNIH